MTTNELGYEDDLMRAAGDAQSRFGRDGKETEQNEFRVVDNALSEMRR